MQRTEIFAVEPQDEPEAAVILAYKGLSTDWTGRGFRYEIGRTYRHQGKVVATKSGFHACEYPLDVFGYYPPAASRFTVVELRGETARETGSDAKIAAAEITLKAEIALPQLIASAVRYVFERAQPVHGVLAPGDREAVEARADGSAAVSAGAQGAASASGRWSAACASGDWGAATASNTRGAATASGRWGATMASGDWGAATASGTNGAALASGRWGAATVSGDWGAAAASGFQGTATATGMQGAALASGQGGAATVSGGGSTATADGYQGAATASGTQGSAIASGRQGSAIASGRWGAATASGAHGVAAASGAEGKARAAEGCALFLVERHPGDGAILSVWSGIAGRGGIKPMQFYRLVGGKPIEVE